MMKRFRWWWCCCCYSIVVAAAAAAVAVPTPRRRTSIAAVAVVATPSWPYRYWEVGIAFFSVLPVGLFLLYWPRLVASFRPSSCVRRTSKQVGENDFIYQVLGKTNETFELENKIAPQFPPLGTLLTMNKDCNGF